eukprot:8585415-Karenia_brevis.AAC.1
MHQRHVDIGGLEQTLTDQGASEDRCMSAQDGLDSLQGASSSWCSSVGAKSQTFYVPYPPQGASDDWCTSEGEMSWPSSMRTHGSLYPAQGASANLVLVSGWQFIVLSETEFIEQS